jgi:4-amino-4-deoxy-L-arabinose transferase-like glycosyltransferase
MVRVSPLATRGVGWFPLLAAAVLCLAAFNLAFRVDVRTVQHWDESLYALTAWEMLTSGEWIGTTFLGQLDYYNSKPPLNVWLIAGSFQLFGVNLVALRIPTMVAALATVAVLIWWMRRRFGAAAAVLSGLVLSTSFAFVQVHGARHANTDALNTLLVVLVIVALWGARTRPWRLAWLGLLLAAIFLLRGMAILLPLAIIVTDELVMFGIRRRGRWAPTAAAVALFVLPVGAWVVARWRIDQWAFLSQLFWYDFVARTVRPIEEHPGSAFFYLGVLQKYHFDWLAASALAAILYPVSRETLRGLWSLRDRLRQPGWLLLIWAVIALLVPTLVRTKVAWYLHPFYPVFAAAVGGLIVYAGRRAAGGPGGWHTWRARTLVAVVVLAACLAQGRLTWASYTSRDLATSSQGVFLAERDQLRGKVVFRRRLDRADIFVLHAMVGATYRQAPDDEVLMRDSRPGDFLLTRRVRQDPRLTLVRTRGEHLLYRRDR